MSGFRRFVQIIFSILAILSQVLSISVFKNISYLTDFTLRFIYPNEYFRLAIVVILAILGLIALVDFF